MTIEARKISLVQQVLTVQHEFILDKLEAVLTDRPPAISQELKAALEQGIQSLDRGEGIPHEEVMAEMKRRHPKYFK